MVKKFSVNPVTGQMDRISVETDLSQKMIKEVENRITGNIMSYPQGIVQTASSVPSIGNKPRDVYLYDEHAFMLQHADPGYLVIFNIQDKKNPIERGTVEIWNGPNSIEVFDDKAFIGANSGKLVVVDVSDPDNPVTLSNDNFGGQKFDIAHTENLVAMADTEGAGINLIDVSDPSAPVSIYNEAFSAGGMDIEESLCYVTDYGNSQVLVYDISDLTAVSKVCTFAVGSMVTSIAVQNNIAYVGEYSDPLLHIVDFNDLSSPAVVQSLDVPDQLTFEGGALRIRDHLYTFTKNGDMCIFDLHDNLNPYFLMKYGFGHDINGGDIDDERGIIAVANYTANELTLLADIRHNMIVGDIVAGRINVKSEFALDGYPITPWMFKTHDNGQVSGDITIDTDNGHQQTLEITGEVTSVTLANAEYGKSVRLFCVNGGSYNFSFGTDWTLSGSVPASATFIVNLEYIQGNYYASIESTF